MPGQHLRPLDDRIRGHIKAGLGDAAIARRVNCGWTRVAKIRKEMGLAPPPPQPVTDLPPLSIRMTHPEFGLSKFDNVVRKRLHYERGAALPDGESGDDDGEAES
jgi:hypothetical protein